MTMLPESRYHTVGALSCALALALAAPAAGAAGLRIVDAWIQEGPPSVPVLAGYLVLENPTPQTVRLVAVRSAVAERIEIHRSDITEDTATMTRITELPVPPRGKLSFGAAGYHLMIYGVKEFPRAGEKVPLELQTGDGSVVRAEAVVRRDDASERSMPDAGNEHHDRQDR